MSNDERGKGYLREGNLIFNGKLFTFLQGRPLPPLLLHNSSLKSVLSFAYGTFLSVFL